VIPAEARNIIDTLESVKHDDDTVLDAIECLSRVVSPSMRDRGRVLVAQVALRARNERKEMQ
jgi:hypothetical protein